MSKETLNELNALVAVYRAMLCVPINSVWRLRSQSAYASLVNDIARIIDGDSETVQKLYENLSQ